MTILELKDKKEILKNELNNLILSGEKENRKLTDNEENIFEEKCIQIQEIDKQIKDREIELKREKQTINNQITIKKMNKRFSLLKTIKDVVEGRSFDDVSENYINKGKEQFRNAGLAYGGQILLPLEERAAIQAQTAGQGLEDISEDTLGIVEALRNKSILVEAGAQMLTGLKGNVKIPVYTGSNVAWAGEVATNIDGAGTFSDVELTPKRLSATVSISRMFLEQDTNNAEALLIADLVRAVNEKLETTLLGNAAGSATQPAGIFNLIAPTALTPTFAEVVGLESTLENAKVYGDLKYLLSPAAKASLRTTDKATSSGKFILENGEIEGRAALSSGNVYATGLALGNWEDYVIGVFGGIAITVDAISGAADDIVKLVINYFVDGKPRRNASFVTATV